MYPKWVRIWTHSAPGDDAHDLAFEALQEHARMRILRCGNAISAKLGVAFTTNLAIAKELGNDSCKQTAMFAAILQSNVADAPTCLPDGMKRDHMLAARSSFVSDKKSFGELAIAILEECHRACKLVSPILAVGFFP